MEERYSFADSITGLTHAFNTSLNLRRHGFTTRLVQVPITLCKGVPGVMHTVVAVSASKPTRVERGLGVKKDKRRTNQTPAL